MPKIKSAKLKEPVRVRTKKLSDGSQSIYLDIYVNGTRSYEFLKMYLLPEINGKVKEQNGATLAAVEAIKSRKIIHLTNSKAGILPSRGLIFSHATHHCESATSGQCGGRTLYATMASTCCHS